MDDATADQNHELNDTVADEYWQQIFTRDLSRGKYVTWMQNNAARSWTQRLARIRNGARADWVEQHRPDPEAWPLPHPPVVIWMPYSYVALCAGCYWLNHRVDNGAQAAGAALLHSLEHCDDPSALHRWGRPLKVWHDPRIADRPPEDWVG